MTDAEIDARARRRTGLVVVGFMAAAPLILPLAVVDAIGWRIVFGWWPWQPAWSGRRYR